MNQSIPLAAAALAMVRPAAESEQAFWRRHLWWPLLAFALCFGTIEVFSLDRSWARDWYFDVHTGHWLGTGSGDWWAHRLLHSAGRWLIRGIAAAALAIWLLSFAATGLREWRRPAGFVVLAMLVATVLAGGLKGVTNVDCPWSLAGFGGHNPYVALFADRPDALQRAKCFPGAHSSSGFALFSFYFAFRDRSRRLAAWLLAGALAVGIAFSIGQEARGAHFLSHDLASAAIVWFSQLGLYVWFLRRSPAPDLH